MIAQDLRDQFEMFAEQAFKTQGDGARMLMALGVPFEEMEAVFEVILDRVEKIEEHLASDPHGVLPALSWLDGFAIGVALERRKISLEGRP